MEIEIDEMNRAQGFNVPQMKLTLISSTIIREIKVGRKNHESSEEERWTYLKHADRLPTQDFDSILAKASDLQRESRPVEEIEDASMFSKDFLEPSTRRFFCYIHANSTHDEFTVQESLWRTWPRSCLLLSFLSCNKLS